MIEIQRPVVGDDFFDREEILQELLETEKNYALVGFRKTGKTSILLNLRERINDPLVSYTYILFSETEHSFLLKFLNNTLATYLRSESIEIEYFEDSIESFNELAGKVVEVKQGVANLILQIKDHIEKPVSNTLIAMAFELPERLTGDRFTVLLDEFQVSANFKPRFLDIFRQKLLEQKKTRYIITGSMIGMMKEILEKENAPLFGHFEIIPVGNFDYETARRFVLDNLKIDELYLNFLLSFTGGHPYYLAVVLDRLLGKPISRPSLLNSIREVLFEPKGQLYIYLKETLEEMFRRRNMSRYFQILKAISLGKHRTKDICSFVSLPMSTIPSYMDFLIFTELILRRKDGYHIKDPVLDFWLRSCHRVQESSLLDMGDKLDYFEGKVHELFSSIKSELGKARESQIREIFIKEGFLVSSGILDGEEFDLIAKKNNKLLIGECKTGNITARVVINFTRKVRKVERSYGVGKKIFFSLFGITGRAGELCRKEGIEVWDLRRINGERTRMGLIKIRF
ncbi:MAG: ATP-binding protein [Candidatus Altiarchaeales archaeon]|nr:ATP-binding protein [Candidatus Altiarchaeales archaeon]